MVFEDSRFGVAAAQAAGMHAIAVLGTEPPERLAAADLVLPELGVGAAGRLRPAARRQPSPRSCAASWSNAPKPAPRSAGVSVAMPLRNSYAARCSGWWK